MALPPRKTSHGDGDVRISAENALLQRLGGKLPEPVIGEATERAKAFHNRMFKEQ